MNIFVDESGIGRKVGYSVYCLTICSSEEKKNINEVVLKIEEKLKIPPFHWREQSWNIKKKFLNKISKLGGWVCIICISENKTYPFETPEKILAKALFGKTVDTIYIDGKKTAKYTHAVKKSLKSLNIHVSKLKLVTSAAHGALRISDAIAGLERLSLEATLDSDVKELHREINKKISARIISGYLPNPPHGR